MTDWVAPQFRASSFKSAHSRHNLGQVNQDLSPSWAAGLFSKRWQAGPSRFVSIRLANPHSATYLPSAPYIAVCTGPGQRAHPPPKTACWGCPCSSCLPGVAVRGACFEPRR